MDKNQLLASIPPDANQRKHTIPAAAATRSIYDNWLKLYEFPSFWEFECAAAAAILEFRFVFRNHQVNKSNHKIKSNPNFYWKII